MPAEIRRGDNPINVLGWVQQARASSLDSLPDKDNFPSVEEGLNREIDAYRDLLENGFARRALNLFEALLTKLSKGVTPHTLIRVKASIGHCYLELEEVPNAVRWLDEAYEAEPHDPKAIANRSLALLVSGEPMAAFQFAKEQLQTDPSNEWVAGYLVQAMLWLPVHVDLESLIPRPLWDREGVILARCLLLRQRELRPEWWELARQGAETYPQNKKLTLLAAEAAVDRLVRITTTEAHRNLTSDERSSLGRAAKTLDAWWKLVSKSETPTRADGLDALNTSMIAHHVLGDASVASTLASEIIDRSESEPAIQNAVQVASACERDDIAQRGLQKLGNSGAAEFLRGMSAFNRGEWKRAAAHFDAASVPKKEEVLVAVIKALVQLEDDRTSLSEKDLEGPRTQACNEPRALILLAGAARRNGLKDLSRSFFQQAVSLVSDATPRLARLVIAAFAQDIGDFASVIDLLGAHIDLTVMSRELQSLADAHASERPHRTRNLRFFESIPKEICQVPTIARDHGSVLIDEGQFGQAEDVLRRVIREAPTDVFAHLKLVETLRRQKRDSDASAAILIANEFSFEGSPSHQIRWAHELRNADAPERASAYGYKLVRCFPAFPRVALGYVGLILGSTNKSIIPDPEQVGADCWVKLQSDSGETDSFVIDEGAPFLGIDVVSPESERARRFRGLRKGGSIELPGSFNQHRIWKVAELKSKYLHVLHVVMNEFEKRFPMANGLWKVSIEDGNIQPILDLIREQAEARREHVQRIYVQQHAPLALAAPILGTDVISLAHYIRRLGLNIVTNVGRLQERDEGISLATTHRRRGVVLDLYTAWVAAEMQALELLRTWFGTVTVAQSSVDKIDDLIFQERSGLGHKMMTVGWEDGQFVRQDITDDYIRAQIDALQSIKAQILLHCEIAPAVFPDEMSELATYVSTKLDAHALDPVFLAKSRNVPLLSDDLFLRQLASGIGVSEGFWLQAVFGAMERAVALDRKTAVRFVVQLAAWRHYNTWLDGELLVDVLRACSGSDLSSFRAVSEFIGGPEADMWSHTVVVIIFLTKVWETEETATLTRYQATSAILESLLRGRGDQTAVWLALIWLCADEETGLTDYLGQWAYGHFLPSEPIERAAQWWRARLLPRRFRQVSNRVLRLSTDSLDGDLLRVSERNPSGSPGRDAKTSSLAGRTRVNAHRQGRGRRKRRPHRGKQG